MPSRRSPDSFQILPRIRVVWIQTERLLELLDGFLYPALSEENSAHVALRAIVLWIQAKGISPDIVVNVPKNQQVANAVISFESDLYGALKNGGSINSPPGAGSATTGRTGAAEAEHPIKPMIIGTGNDPQVAAALDFLQKAVRREAGAQHG